MGYVKQRSVNSGCAIIIKHVHQKECSHISSGINCSKTKLANPEITRAAYFKGRETILSKNPNGLKELSQRGALTRRESGIDKIAAAKASKTKKQAGEDGLNIAQRSRYKQIETLKNTPHESGNGKSKFDMVGKNISKSLTNNPNLIKSNAGHWGVQTNIQA